MAAIRFRRFFKLKMSTPTSLHSIREIHDAFDRKALTATELTKQYLAKAHASSLNSFLTFCDERALTQAKFADDLIAKEGRVPREQMPLLGIPLGIKDVLTIEGVRTTCGSKVLDNYIPPYTATSVERLEK